MAEQPLKQYVAVTVAPEPLIYVLADEDMPRKSIDSGPVFHSWLRSATNGIVGVKFSSWMIKQGKLPQAEKATVTRWNQSESDFEVFFGKSREYDHAEQDDEASPGYIMRLDDKTLAICFPVHGSTLKKGEVESLTSSLPVWAKPTV